MRNIFARNEEGFSAAELLITLFIASLFLIAGYQLYTYVVRDGEESAQLSKASNLAYQYLRSTATNTAYVKSPCSTSSQPGSQALASSTGLNSASVNVVISCPYSSDPLNKTTLLTATVTYSSPSGQETASHAMLTKAVDGPVTFNYTGSVQTWKVPAGVTSVLIECWGAQGGAKGGYSKGTLSVTPGETLNIYVGGAPASTAPASEVGGWNGGGTGYEGVGGGGASDVRQGGTALSNRKIVAGGGGGASSSSNAGVGGGLTGGSSSDGNTGGSQTAGGTWGGSLGQGGSAGYKGSGGGGGYYGGGSKDYPGIATGGGGGSGYIGGVTGGTMSSGVQSGNGQIIITYN